MYEQIVAILAKQLQIDPSRITEDTDIVEDLGADSLDIVEALMELEQTFSISVPDEEIVKRLILPLAPGFPADLCARWNKNCRRDCRREGSPFCLQRKDFGWLIYWSFINIFCHHT